VETLLRLALVPAAVWLASLAARRWGHTVSGYLGGMPLIGGPITFFLAIDQGAAFAAQSAMVTLAAILGQAAHLLAFSHAAHWKRWSIALAAGWSGYFGVSTAIAQLPLTPLFALALALGGLILAWLYLPRPSDAPSLPLIPAAELWLRLVAAFALAILIVSSAEAFGPIVSGVLLSLPVTGSIMPPFTLALYGAGALARLMRGFVVGLAGFTAFFFVVAATVVPWGVAPAFTLAIAAALVGVSVARRLALRRR
jgi:hypothetical protein